MKKVCSLFFAVLFLVTITGCGSSSKSEITCSQKEDDSNYSVTVKTDKNDKITFVKTSIEMPSETEEELNTIYEMMKTSADKMNKTDGVKYDVSKKNLNLIVVVEVDLNKVSDEIKSELNLDEFNTTGTEFRKSAEADGATCK